MYLLFAAQPSRRRSGSHRKSGGDHHHNPSGRSRKGSSHEKSSSSHRHHSSSTSSHKRRSHVESDSDSDPMGFGSAANKSASSTLMPFDDIFGGPTPGSAQVPPGSETGGSLTPSQKAGVIQNLFHGGMATQGTGEQVVAAPPVFSLLGTLSPLLFFMGQSRVFVLVLASKLYVRASLYVPASLSSLQDVFSRCSVYLCISVVL